MNGFDPSRLLGPLVAVMFVFLIFSNKFSTGKAKETPEGLVFPVKPIYAWSRILLLPLYMAFFIWIAWRQNHAIPWPIIVLCVLAILIGLVQMPGTITLTATAVIQTFWLQPSKSISYGEVTTLQALQSGRAILVLGDNRIRIRHSVNHAASIDFQREMERRTGKHVIV
jgi:hypothetical protein